jgi:hypothetical protein
MTIAGMRTMGPECVCESCTVFTDDYATDRTGTDYTVDSGTVNVTGGVIEMTSAGTVIVEDTVSPSNNGRVFVENVTGNTSGSSWRVIGAYTGPNDYLYFEGTVSGGVHTCKLWEKVSGSDTQIGATSSFTYVGAFNVELCWNGAFATARAINLGGSAAGPSTKVGGQCGLGGSPNGGTVSFSSLTLSKHSDDDPTCTACFARCSLCNNNTGANMQPLTLTLNQITSNGSTTNDCGDCSSFNGTYLLDYIGQDANWCIWRYTFPAAKCNGGSSFGPITHLECRILNTTLKTWDVYLIKTAYPGVPYIWTIGHGGAGVRCDTFSETLIGGSNSNNGCKWATGAGPGGGDSYAEIQFNS